MGNSSYYTEWTREELIAELEYRDNSKSNQRLLEAVEVMAEQGLIHNTPYAKREWMAGR